jgi:multidrug efflux pump subunit AcrB
MAVGIGSFVLALGLAPLVGSEFVPQTDQGYTQLALRMPVGSSLERTDAKVQQVEPSCCHARGGPSPPGWAGPASATRPG